MAQDSAGDPPHLSVPSHSRVKRIGFYLLMGPLEIYGRLSGVYRPRFPGQDHTIINADACSSRTVVCFGDSLTEGFGASPGNSYPDQLARRLAPYDMEVLNLGRSGETSADGRERLQADVLSLKQIPCTVIVGFGGNDLMQRRSIDATFLDLQVIVDRLQNAGCLVVLLGIRGSWLYKIDYETPFHNLAKTRGCALVPLCLDGIWGYPWRMSDAAHPNARGYTMLASRVAAVIQRVREQNAPGNARLLI